jgi:hypothetical protein
MSPGGPVGLASTLLAGGRRAPEEDAIRIRARRRPADDAAFQVRRNVERVRLEMAVRALVGVLVLVFNEVHGLRTGLGADPVIRAVAALGVALNGPTTCWPPGPDAGSPRSSTAGCSSTPA